MQVGYGLYTDSGDMYSGDDKQTLVAAVAHHANLADSSNARELAAARYAAAGDLATARVRMVDALDNDSSSASPHGRRYGRRAQRRGRLSCARRG